MYDPWVEVIGTIWVALIGLAAIARLTIFTHNFVRPRPDTVADASADFALDSDDASDPELTMVATSDAE